ncbi:MAG: ATP-binding cassette domain-containing protein [Albidovulum sp.]|nr:ATP-binding cassette domain-containing protein [Albidovulum sp.]
MLELQAVRKSFGGAGIFGKARLKTLAVADISLTLGTGQTLGIVGESGSGKSTLARIALRLIAPDAGHVIFEGNRVTHLSGLALIPFRRAVQPVFQDAAGALDPRMKVRRILSEPLVLRKDVARSDWPGRIDRIMEAVGLPLELLGRRPGTLSGGQRQRVGIARALLMEPKVLILDEPVSALDVSVQAQILNLLVDLQRDFGLSYLFVTHDLAVAEYFCDDILVMHLGRQVEFGSAESLFRAPDADYTRRLIAAMPREL